ncbi:MAG: site-specific DNA-methyltransferase [Oscillospiraceae bacterium]|jgi:hypothetical protein|nr:site-specific DNA-methyltransferase [Oscillospiraceae bacterium]
MNKQEHELWQTIAEIAGDRWTEDTVFRLTGRGALFTCGDSDGKYISASENGLLSVGSFSEAFPHTGMAFFTPEWSKQYAGFEKAMNAAHELGGKAFWDEVYSPDIGEYAGLPTEDCIWSKPNTMPESVTDRCVKSHEYLFLFAKSQRYYFDYKAIRELAVDARKNGVHKGSAKYARPMTEGGSIQSLNRSNGRSRCQWENGQALRNKRSVWTVPTKGISDSHFAAYPPALIEPCILAGCPPGEVVLDPFMGSGTTAMTAAALGRQYIGFELNPDYIKIAEKRIKEGK